MNLKYFLENNFSNSLTLFFKELNIPLNNSIEERFLAPEIFKENFNEKKSIYHNESHIFRPWTVWSAVTIRMIYY